MSKKLEDFEWFVTMDGKKYGSKFIIKKKMTNSDISEMVDILAEQIKESLQKIINGESDLDIRFKEATNV